MTNNQTEAQTEEQEAPALQTFTIETTKTIEVDFAERQLQSIIEQTDSDTAGEAIETIFFQRASQQVEPEQKLVGLNVNADES